MSLTTTITMPQLGETVTEGTITRWLKNVGDSIQKYEAFAEIATDKVNAEIPSPVAGTLLAILVNEGETVPTGAPIAHIGALAQLQQSPLADRPGPHPASPAAPIAVRAASDVADVPRPPSSVSLPSEDPRRGRYSPAVRRALREHQLNPLALVGTGQDGRLTLKDVVQASQSPATQRIPLSRARRSIAEHMLHASQTIPHAWTMVEIDVSQIVAKRQTQREHLLAAYGFVPTYFHYFAHAVVSALAQHPFMNARFCGDTIEVYRHIDLSFAVALQGTLVTPVVHGAGCMSFITLSQAIAAVTERARKDRLTINELQGGTITINNTGANGSILSQPIINGGQAAIISLEAIVKRPIVVEGDAIAIRSMVNVCCTIDHRVIDGDVVGAFLQDVKTRLTLAQ